MREVIYQNIKAVQHKINLACTQVNRNPAEVRLLLATKTVNPYKIAQAIEMGYPLIAENKVQELKAKSEILTNIIHESHFIGHLQTNKIKEVLRHGVTCIQSVDRLDLAVKLNDRLKTLNQTIDILIQVNTSAEESKFGVIPQKAIELVEQIALLPNLKIKGLMTIGLFSTDIPKIQACYKLLKKLEIEIATLNIPNVEMNELSMGMSNDYEIAIQEGATIVRIGTAIFGEREYPDSYYWNEKTK